jgi:cytochrome c6
MLRTRNLQVATFVLAFASLLAASTAGALVAARSSTATTRISVTLTDTSITLSRKSVPAGKVSFSVVNKGKKAHNFRIAGKRTRTLEHGQRTVLIVTVKPGTKVAYSESSPRKSGVLVVASAGKKSSSTTAQIAAGKKVFETAGCKSCHTLKEAGATGTIGPNLDQIKPGEATVVQFVTNGYNGVGAAVPMPSFEGQLSTTQIKDVAAFVYTSTH